MKLVISKGGKGSGHFGHSGRPGEVGGSSPGGGRLFEIRTLAGYPNLRHGERVPTDEELQIVRTAIQNLPSEIQALRPPRERIMVTVEKDAAEAYGTSIYIDERYLRGSGRDYGSIIEHEYIHTIVAGNRKIDRTIQRDYQPPYLYAHAEGGQGTWGQLNEQFTMVMTAFDSDESVWREQVKAIENYHREQQDWDAQDQIEAVKNYLKGLKLW